MIRSLAIALLLALLAVSCLAQKVIVDPNAGTPKPPEKEVEAVATPAPVESKYDPSKDPDARMTRKVSYEAMHARLGTVVAEIARKTGVGISCGTSTKNWQVRDIPVTVYAKDLPLGVLLRAIARATHNVLRAEVTDGETRYRIYQDPRLTKQFQDYSAAMLEYRKAMFSYQWDSLVSLKDVPKGEFRAADSNPVRASLRLEAMIRVSELLAALPPDYRHRVIEGVQVSLTPADAPEALKAPLLAALNRLDELRLSYNAPNAKGVRTVALTEDELQKVSLRLSAPDRNSAGQQVEVLEGSVGGPIGLSFPLSTSLLRPVDPKKANPIKIRPPVRPQIADDPSVPDVDFADAAWKMPGMDSKIDLDDLVSRKGLSSPTVVAEAMKRAGISVVLEDWDYHKDSLILPKQLFKKDVRASDCLSNVWGRLFRGSTAHKVVIGIDQLWATKHECLAPAAAIDSLTTKLNTSGVDVEDLLPALSFTAGQWTEWVQNSKALGAIPRHVTSPGDPMWAFYAGLTPSDRAKAATAEGLSMELIDPAYLTSLIESSRKAVANRPSIFISAKAAIPDEKGLAGLVLRLRTQTTTYHDPNGNTLPAGGRTALPEGLGVCKIYSLDLTGIHNFQQQTYAASTTLYELPFYSADREAELIKSVTGAAAISQLPGS